MRHYAIILILLAGSVTSCAPPKPIIEQLPPQSQRIPLKGFSISIPSEQGWIVVQGNTQAVQLAKKGNGMDETYAIQV
jgi:hypothetical protein